MITDPTPEMLRHKARNLEQRAETAKTRDGATMLVAAAAYRVAAALEEARLQ